MKQTEQSGLRLVEEEYIGFRVPRVRIPSGAVARDILHVNITRTCRMESESGTPVKTLRASVPSSIRGPMADEQPGPSQAELMVT